MESVIEGRVFKFGDNINSDIIIPGRYLIYIDRERLGQHAFEMLGEGFPDKLRSFDILVAGRNFGCGSAREQAATAIQGLGYQSRRGQFVCANVLSQCHQRRAPHRGMPGPLCGGEEGDRIRIDLEAGKIQLADKDYPFPKMPESVRKILELGGLAEYLKTQM